MSIWIELMNKFRPKPPPATADEFVQDAGVSAGPVPVDDSDSVYRSLTLRLDKARYKRLKMHSTISEMPIQRILVQALDAYLANAQDSQR